VFATPRNAVGDGPCDDLGIVAGEPFEGHQGAHDLTRALQVHLANNRPLDGHVDSLTTTAGMKRYHGWEDFSHAFDQPTAMFRPC
jgi:hypothetical protein